MSVVSFIGRVFTARQNPVPPIRAQSKFLYSSFYAEPLLQSVNISEKFAFCLENCSDVVSLKKVHASIFMNGLRNNIFLGSKLLNCYAKFGLLCECRWVFERIINRNLSLWNSVLSGYFKAGHFGEVLEWYTNLRQSKIGLDSAALTFSLKCCVELGSLGCGRGVHGDAFKFGLSIDQFVGSSLITLYSKLGELGDASKVFEEITEIDVVVYTSMITGYAQSGDHRAYEAFQIAREMLTEQVHPNRVTLVSLLQAAAQLEALRAGLSVHGYAIRRGIGYLDEVFEISLLDMYIKCRASKMSNHFFKKMNRAAIGSWNVMISGNLNMGQPLEALNIFCLMMQENVAPDLITLANGVLCCADLKRFREGKSIHGHTIRIDLRLDLVATTALVDFYSKCNKLVQAENLFNGTEKRDVVLYNVMIAGYLDNKFPFKAMETFVELIRTDIKPNLGSILHLLSASSSLKDSRHGKCVHGYVLRCGFALNTEISNQIICMHSRCGSLVDARQVFNSMKHRDLVSWTSMINGCIYHGHGDEAVVMFRMMKREKVDHDSIALMNLLQASSQLGSLGLAKEVHCQLYRLLMERDIPAVNSLISTYAKCGKLDMAKSLFEHMSGRCLTSWNTMIAAYGMHGNCTDARKLFDRMKEKKVKPDEITFTSILTACSHAGLVEEAQQIFRSMMEEYSIAPCREHYGCIVDSLSRAGQLEEAYDLVKHLPSSQRASALGALLAACRVHRNRRLGRVIGRHLLELEPKNSSAYALVSNLCAEDGKWDEVACIRGMAKDRGLKVTPGYSSIELDKLDDE